MPVPETDTPAPIAAMVVVNVTLVEALVVVPTAVNTPTGASVVPVNSPYNGVVFTVDEMSTRFWPGCAMRLFFAFPSAS